MDRDLLFGLLRLIKIIKIVNPKFGPETVTYFPPFPHIKIDKFNSGQLSNTLLITLKIKKNKKTKKTKSKTSIPKGVTLNQVTNYYLL